MTETDLRPQLPLRQLVVRGVLGGTVAGAVFGALNMWYAHSAGDDAEAPMRMISTLVLGDDAIADGDANAVLGGVVHMTLSIGYGVLFALLTGRVRTNGAVALAGGVYGLALYVMNFLVLSPLAFTVFEDANQPFEVVVHIVFGYVLSHFLYGAGARRAAPSTTAADTLDPVHR